MEATTSTARRKKVTEVPSEVRDLEESAARRREPEERTIRRKRARQARRVHKVQMEVLPREESEEGPPPKRVLPEDRDCWEDELTKHCANIYGDPGGGQWQAGKEDQSLQAMERHPRSGGGKHD